MTQDHLPDRAEALATRPWTRLLERCLGDARRVPTMLSAEEQKLYYWLAAFWAEGAGEIVDLGCFAGGSTARLAEGHRAAGHTSGLHAFDRFTADEAVKKAVLYPQGVAPFAGDDILPLAQERLAPWAPAIRFHRGEIDRMGWDGGPIELLVMDASKAAQTGDRMAATFFPHLIAGGSLVVQQDYLHWSQPWVAVQMELLAPCFRPVAMAPRDTVVFLCERVPSPAELAAAAVDGLSDTEMQHRLAAAAQRLEGWGVGAQVAALRKSLTANPGKRRAFDFVKPGQT